MPIYEYKCDHCGVIEVMQRITENPLKKCPNCKGKVDRIISNTSFVLKGSGWYATDYANKAKPDSSKTESTGDSSSASATPAAAPANGSSTESKASGEKSKPASEKSTTKSAD